MFFNPRALRTKIPENIICIFQGIHLRVAGIFDSKSFLVVPDVSSMEFNDTFLMNICQIKSNGLSLQTCVESGNSIDIFTASELCIISYSIFHDYL